jgi:hypothetical protein
MAAIELAQPRVIVIDDRGFSYKLTVGRISKKAWLKYFEGIHSASEHQNGELVESFDATSARVELVTKELIDAEGYASSTPITSIANWQEQIPLRHRLTVGGVLVSARHSAYIAPENAPLPLGVETVFLDAVWAADEHGMMREYQVLCHRFRTPSGEHQRRYARDSSRSRVIGGSRSGKTIYMGAQATLIDLYDELIESVEGYVVNGQELIGHEAIAREMDAYHKVVAAAQLFAPAAPKVEER